MLEDEHTSAQQQLIDAARTRAEVEKTKALQQHLITGGQIDEGDGLIKAINKYPRRRPRSEVELPPATHIFAYPLKKDQLSKLVAGDKIANFPLSHVLHFLNRENPAWLDPLGKRAASTIVEGLNCELTVENVELAHETIVVQTQLPDTPQLSAQAFWHIQLVAFAVKPRDLQSMRDNLSHTFHSIIGR